MKNTNVDMLAGSRDLNAWEPTKIFAGESDIHTDSGVASAAIEMYQPVIRKDDGTIAPFDDAAYTEWEADKTKAPIGVSTQAAVAGGPALFYTGGTLNIDAITWPTEVTDLVKAKALFELGRSTIIIKKLY